MLKISSQYFFSSDQKLGKLSTTEVCLLSRQAWDSKPQIPRTTVYLYFLSIWMVVLSIFYLLIFSKPPTSNQKSLTTWTDFLTLLLFRGLQACNWSCNELRVTKILWRDGFRAAAAGIWKHELLPFETCKNLHPHRQDYGLHQNQTIHLMDHPTCTRCRSWLSILC